MQRAIADIFASASSLSLDDGERAAVRRDLHAFMSQERESPADEALLASLRGVRLAVPEKEAMRRALEEHVRSSPSGVPLLPARWGDRLAELFFHLSFRRLPIVAAFVLVFVGAGGALAAQSSSAMPGDFLYPVKTTIAEHPYLHLRFAAVAQAEWEESLAARRLGEAAALLSQGRLTDEARAAIAGQLDLHTSRAVAHRARAGAASSGALDQTLREHEQTIRAIYGDKTEAEVQVRVLLDRVAAAKKEVERTENASSKSMSVPARDIALSAREQIDGGHRRLEQVRLELNAAGDTLTADMRTDAQTRATQAGTLLAQAEAKYAAKAWDDALSLATKANLTLQESKLLIRAGGELQIDVRGSTGASASSEAPQVRGARKVMRLRGW